MSSPAGADIILCAEPGHNKFRAWAGVLERDPSIWAHPEKVFVYEFSDRPVGHLSGLYCAMQPATIDWVRMRPADMWGPSDGAVEQELLGRMGEPRWLFSFRGSNSAGVRERLFEMDVSALRASITRTYRWWDYGEAANDEGRRVYLNEIRDSSFVLCPRGLSPTTLRVYETMQLGRVPVIISDDWLPPSGVPWADFSLRVGEDRIADLPEILEARRDEACEMGRAARDAWERWIRPGPVLMRRWLRAIEEIVQMRPAGWDEAAVYRQWHSNRFLWDNRIHPLQGAAHRLRNLMHPTTDPSFGEGPGPGGGPAS
ncbi:MAG: exostosin domain-containing protein [Acidimicrobiales bacterium]